MAAQLALDPLLMGVLTPQGKGFDGVVHMVGELRGPRGGRPRQKDGQRQQRSEEHPAFASRIMRPRRLLLRAGAGQAERHIHGTSCMWNGCFLQSHAAYIPQRRAVPKTDFFTLSRQPEDVFRR